MGRISCVVFVSILSLKACFAVLPYLYEIERPEVYHQVKPVATSSSTNKRPTLPVCDPSINEGTYAILNAVFCDQFFYCDKGHIKAFQCEDGYAWSPYQGCKLLHTVDCSKRPRLQAPRGTEPCRRRNEIRAEPEGCGHFLVCENNKASYGRCPPRQSFDDLTKTCGAQTNVDRVNCVDQLPPRPLEAVQPNRTDAVPSIVVSSADLNNASMSTLQVIDLRPTPGATPQPGASSQGQPQSVDSIGQVQQRPQPTSVQPFQSVVPAVQNTLRPRPTQGSGPLAINAGLNLSGSLIPSRPAVSVPTAPTAPIGCPTTPCDPALSNWRCPAESYLQFGDHARYPYFNSCDQFIICYRDRSYRVAGCEVGQAFNRVSKVCVPEKYVLGCNTGRF